jgi:hypothetical protein
MIEDKAPRIAPSEILLLLPYLSAKAPVKIWKKVRITIYAP